MFTDEMFCLQSEFPPNPSNTDYDILAVHTTLPYAMTNLQKKHFESWHLEKKDVFYN